MKTEELRAKGLDDDQIAYVMAESGKEITTLKTKIATLEDETKVKAGVIEEKNNRIKELESTDIDALKLAEYERGKAEGCAEMEKFKFNATLDNTLKEYKVRDSKAISGLLDMDKIKLENDAIVGLDEQIKTLKETHEYLFEADDKAPTFTKNVKPGEATKITREAFEKMSYRERVEFKNKNPEEFKTFIGG